jgi:hypothetical protein
VPADQKSDGEPVDLEHRVFVMNKTDLALTIGLTRTYRNADLSWRAALSPAMWNNPHQPLFDLSRARKRARC